jgi:hypothetical protein
MSVLEIPLRSLGRTVRLDPRKPRRGMDPEAWARSYRQIAYWHERGAHRRLVLHLVLANVLTLDEAARADLRHRQPDRWFAHSEISERERELELLIWSRPNDLFATDEQLDAMPTPVKKQRRRGPFIIALPSGRSLTLRAAEPPDGIDPSAWRSAIRRITSQHRHDSYMAFFELVGVHALTPEEGAHELVSHQRQRGLQTRDFESFLLELRYLHNQPLPPPRPPRPMSLWRQLERA